jgi:hypothetical protein
MSSNLRIFQRSFKIIIPQTINSALELLLTFDGH